LAKVPRPIFAKYDPITGNFQGLGFNILRDVLKEGGCTAISNVDMSGSNPTILLY